MAPDPAADLSERARVDVRLPFSRAALNRIGRPQRLTRSRDSASSRVRNAMPAIANAPSSLPSGATAVGTV